MCGIANARIEVDDAVKNGVAANPVVDVTTDGFSRRTIGVCGHFLRGSLEGRERRDEGRQTVIVRARRDLRQAEDDIGRRDGLARVDDTHGDVVVPFEDDDVSYSRLAEYVAAEPSERWWSAMIREKLVSVDRRRQDAHHRPLSRRL